MDHTYTCFHVVLSNDSALIIDHMYTCFLAPHVRGIPPFVWLAKWHTLTLVATQFLLYESSKEMQLVLLISPSKCFPPKSSMVNKTHIYKGHWFDKPHSSIRDATMSNKMFNVQTYIR